MRALCSSGRACRLFVDSLPVLACACAGGTRTPAGTQTSRPSFPSVFQPSLVVRVRFPAKHTYLAIDAQPGGCSSALNACLTTPLTNHLASFCGRSGGSGPTWLSISSYSSGYVLLRARTGPRTAQGGAFVRTCALPPHTALSSSSSSSMFFGILDWRCWDS